MNDQHEINGTLSCLSKPDGSAEFSINKTFQMAAVYGPGEVKIMKELAEKAYISVIYKPRVGISTNREKVLEYAIRSICDGTILTNLHPRTAINIIVQEIQNDGNYLACALNCICLALLDANIPLKYTFAAVSCSLMENENKVVFFPSSKQEKESFATCTFLFDSVEKEIINVNLNGSLDIDQFNHLLNNARQYAIDKIFPLFTSLIDKKYSKES